MSLILAESRPLNTAREPYGSWLDTIQAYKASGSVKLFQNDQPIESTIFFLGLDGQELSEFLRGITSRYYGN